MSEELKPCPFCGDTPTGDSHTLTQGFKYGAIECGCGAIGPDVRTGYEDWPAWKEGAVKEWNERAELAALKAGQGEAAAYVKPDSPIKGHTEFCRHETWMIDEGENIMIAGGWFPLYLSAQPASADAVSVPRELLETLMGDNPMDAWGARKELRALLAQSQEVQ